jgi:hypothetical protein
VKKPRAKTSGIILVQSQWSNKAIRASIAEFKISLKPRLQKGTSK